MKNNSTASFNNKPVELIALPRDNLAAVIAVLDGVLTISRDESPERRLVLETFEDLLDVYNRRKPATFYVRPRRVRP